MEKTPRQYLSCGTHQNSRGCPALPLHRVYGLCRRLNTIPGAHAFGSHLLDIHLCQLLEILNYLIRRIIIPHNAPHHHIYAFANLQRNESSIVLILNDNCTDIYRFATGIPDPFLIIYDFQCQRLETAASDIIPNDLPLCQSQATASAALIQGYRHRSA